MKKENLATEEGLRVFYPYKSWFDSKNFEVHDNTLEYMEKHDHWKIDATVENEHGKKTHTFYMNSSTLEWWQGIGKPRRVIMRLTTDPEPSKFDEMRRAIGK